MKPNTISKLLRRYFEAGKTGSDAYFDVDDIIIILDKFEQIEDFTNYDELLQLGLRLHPGNTELRLKKCKQHIRKKEYREALKLVEATAAVKDSEAAQIKVECYYRLNRHDKARAIVESIMATGSDNSEEICELLAVLLNDNEASTTTEREFIRKAALMFPDNLTLKDEYCFSLETDGKYDEAIRVCNEILDAEPYSYEDWFVLGRLHSLNESYEAAIDAFDTAAVCGDPDDELIAMKAYCYYMNENYEKAIDSYRGILTTEDNEANYHISSLLSDCYTRVDNYEQAYRLLKTLVRKSITKDPYNNISFARCCIKTDRNAEALPILPPTAEQLGGGMRVFTLLAYSCLENEMEDISLMILEQMLKYLDKNPDEFPIFDSEIDPKTALEAINDQPKHTPISELIQTYLNRIENRN
ncbi:MAG: tetratricopeptide repeat protein [Tannerellaceae bacterium]|jgi:tetratricopeptide (TPR) repeat protein|nr:tetratricopeptide repeat protein [Tannerellaceae bacterium]